MALLRQEGTVNRLAWMTTWPENRWFVSAGHGYVAYRVHAGVAVGLCDPVAADEADRGGLLGSFADAVRAAGLVPCLFTVTGEAARHAGALGWQSLQVAEEAVIDLPTLAFTGKSWQDVRTALNQAGKLGIELRLGPLVEQPRGIQMQVKAISSEWVEDKGLPEMGFTLGGVDEAMDPHVHVGLAVDADSTVHGVTSWMPIHDVGGERVGWTLDVMRRLPGGFRYSMEFLISSACLAFRDQGFQVVSLSGRAAGALGRSRLRWRRPRPRHAGRLPRPSRRRARALLRLPLAARLQEQVPATDRSALPRLPGSGGPATHRHRPQSRVPPRGRRRGPARAGQVRTSRLTHLSVEDGIHAGGKVGSDTRSPGGRWTLVGRMVIVRRHLWLRRQPPEPALRPAPGWRRRVWRALFRRGCLLSSA